MNIPFNIIEQLWESGFSETNATPLTFCRLVGQVGHEVLVLTERNGRVLVGLSMVLATDSYPAYRLEDRSFHSIESAVSWAVSALKPKSDQWLCKPPTHWSNSFGDFITVASDDELVINLEIPVGWTSRGNAIRAYSDIRVTREPATSTFAAIVATDGGDPNQKHRWEERGFATMQTAMAAAESASSSALIAITNEVASVELTDGTILPGCLDDGWYRDMQGGALGQLVYTRALGARLEQVITLTFAKAEEAWLVTATIESRRADEIGLNYEEHGRPFTSAATQLSPMSGGDALRLACVVATQHVAVGAEAREEADWALHTKQAHP